MTLKEFRAKTARLPDHLDIMIEQRNDESRYSMAEATEVRMVTFGGGDIPRKEWAKVECLVLTDDIV